MVDWVVVEAFVVVNVLVHEQALVVVDGCDVLEHKQFFVVLGAFVVAGVIVVLVVDWVVVEAFVVVNALVHEQALVVVNGFAVLEHEQVLVVLGTFVVVNVGIVFGHGVVPILILHLVSFTEIHSPPKYNLAYSGMQSQPLIGIKGFMLHSFL